jgi:hypothetical protein
MDRSYKRSLMLSWKSSFSYSEFTQRDGKRQLLLRRLVIR